MEMIQFSNDNIKNSITQIIKSKLIPQPIKIRSIFELTCFTFDGIDAIKQSLLNGEKKGTENIPIKFRYLRSPLYECSVETYNKNEELNVMNIVLKEVEKSIEDKGGNYSLKVKPEEVEGKEKSIEEQIKECSNNKYDEEEDIKYEEEGIKPDVFTNNCNYIYK